MPKYQVTGTLKVLFDIEVEADDEDGAIAKVECLDYETFTNLSQTATVDVDDAIELPAKKTG